MVSIIVPLEDETKDKIDRLSWVNWSEVGREQLLKKEMFERYVKKEKLTKEDLKFCDEIDWHPVDWLPLREEFIKRLEEIGKGPHSKMTLEQLDKLLGLK